MIELDKRDLDNCATRLPAVLSKVLREDKVIGRAVVAGGFVSSVVTNTRINDCDVFVASQEVEDFVIDCIVKDGWVKRHLTLNATTLTHPSAQGSDWMFTTIQVISHLRVTVDPKIAVMCMAGKESLQLGAAMFMDSILSSFDFTICKAGIGRVFNEWVGFCTESYYRDLSAKQLVYCPSPNVGSSFARMLKYVSKGYSIDPKQTGVLLTSLVKTAHEVIKTADTNQGPFIFPLIDKTLEETVSEMISIKY